MKGRTNQSEPRYHDVIDMREAVSGGKEGGEMVREKHALACSPKSKPGTEPNANKKTRHTT